MDYGLMLIQETAKTWEVKSNACEHKWCWWEFCPRSQFGAEIGLLWMKGMQIEGPSGEKWIWLQNSEGLIHL